MKTTVLALAALLALLGPLPAGFAAGRGEPGPVFPVEIRLRDRIEDLRLLLELDIDVDGVHFDRARAYLVEKELVKLRELGFDVEQVADEARLQWERERTANAPLAAAAPGSIPPSYHTYATLTSELQQIAAAHPDLVRLTSAGLSVQGRELWIVKVSDHPELAEDEPAARYIAAIHGDEVVGKELCIGLIHYLVDNYATDPRIEALVDETEIWILPSMNPDGTELGQRYNADGYDLNRSFPDQFTDPVDSPAWRPAEVRAVMNWGAAHSVGLSANFHGGELVANYPYDGTASGSSVYSACPDDVPLVTLARTYADRNPSMFANNSDGSFFNGVCNGADWYVVRGGMQDWNYVWRGTWDVTMEIGAKWPPASTLPSYWEENREAMLAYLERVQEGVRGVVTDATTGAPLKATVKVVGNAADSYGDPEVGDYHRIVLPGTYTLELSASGYVDEILRDVVVPAGGPAVRRDVPMQPTTVDLQPAGFTILDGAGGNGVLDPGETTDLAVVLRNLGANASGISGELQPVGWYATVPRDAATYPAIAAGESAPSQPPHYAVSLAPTAPAGTKVGFAVGWTESSKSGTSDPFWVPVGTRSCTTYNSTGGAVPVPDRSTRTSTIAVTSQVEIDEVNVYVDISHSYKGDLAVSALSPAGTPVALHNRTGGAGSNIVGWYDSPIAPAEPLARFNGEGSQGTWTLKVTDAVPANSGTLNGWSVEVCGRPFEARPPEMRLRAVTRRGGDVVLEWWPYPGLASYKVYRGVDPASAASFADVTSSDPDAADTLYQDATAASPLLMYLVTGVGPRGESPWGHHGQ